MPRRDVDRALLIRFHRVSMELPIETKKAGRKICKDVDYLEIIWDAGASIVDRPVLLAEDNEELAKDFLADDQRFRDEFEMYQKGQSQIIGTPLSVLFPHSPAKCEEYSSIKVFTVEQLSGLSDSVVGKMMGALEDRKTAIKFLENASRQAPVIAALAEVETLRQQIKFQTEQLEEFRKLLNEPPKDVQHDLPPTHTELANASRVEKISVRDALEQSASSLGLGGPEEMFEG